jgi:hypothetical protein
MQVKQEKNSNIQSLQTGDGLSVASELPPSPLAEAISEAIDGTTNYAETIDRVIRDNAEIRCIYCGDVSFRGLVNEGDRWGGCIP